MKRLLAALLLVSLVLSGCSGAEPAPTAPSNDPAPLPAPPLAESDPVVQTPVPNPDLAVDIPSAQSFSGDRLQVYNAEDQDAFSFVLYEYEGNRAFQQEYIRLIQENYPFVLRGYLGDPENDPNEDHEYAFDYTGSKDVSGFDTAEYLFGKVMEDVELHISFSYWKDAAPTVYVKYASGLNYGPTDERADQEQGTHSEAPQTPQPEPEPSPAEKPGLPADDVTLPSIQSFANYQLKPKGDKYTDAHTVLFYALPRNDAFTQEYIDLLTEHYHFSLRGSAPYREGSGDYFDGAMVYYFDYTGTAPIVGFYDNTTEEFGKVYDVDLIVTARKAGFTIEFADGLVWTDTDDRSTIFGGNEPQYPSGGGGGYEGDDDDDDKPRRCAVCGGDGEVDCSSCGGSGEKDCVSCSGRGYTERYVSSPNYSGSGTTSRLEQERCFSCGGDGEDDCYSCRGRGEKDCTSCGGDGEK